MRFSFGGRGYWEARKFDMHNDFAMAEFEKITPPQQKGKIEKNREVVFNEAQY